MSTLTREEAIKEVGLASVVEVEGKAVDFTNRVLGNGYVEFSATVAATDAAGDRCNLVMLIEVSQEELDSYEELDLVDWDKAIVEATYQIV